MRKLKAYMAFSRKNGPESGAMLVFHYTEKEAKIIAWPAVQECICEEFIDIGIRLIDDAPWLFDEMEKNEPHVIESPKSCNICGCWGTSGLTKMEFVKSVKIKQEKIMNEFKTVKISMSKEFISQLRLNCQAKRLFPELKKEETTAMECLGLFAMLLANNAKEEQIADLLPDEWYGEIGSPIEGGDYEQD